MSLSETIVNEIMKHMPHGAVPRRQNNFGSFTLHVHWKLQNDSERPNKHSKTIAIVVPQEFIEDFPNYPESIQQSALSKLSAYISAQLKTFDPEHNSRRGEPEPVERWNVPIERLFG